MLCGWWGEVGVFHIALLQYCNCDLKVMLLSVSTCPGSLMELVTTPYYSSTLLSETPHCSFSRLLHIPLVAAEALCFLFPLLPEQAAPGKFPLISLVMIPCMLQHSQAASESVLVKHFLSVSQDGFLKFKTYNMVTWWPHTAFLANNVFCILYENEQMFANSVGGFSSAKLSSVLENYDLLW